MVVITFFLLLSIGLKIFLNNPMHTSSITQQVIKYCEMGFFPICKLQNGEYRIYTPFKYEDKIQCSHIYLTLERAKKSSIIETFTNLINHENSYYEYLPSEIIGFYHPEFKLFEIGDKVAHKNGINRSNVMGQILAYDYHQKKYLVSFVSRNLVSRADVYYRHCELEPYLEPAQLKPLEVTLEDIAKKFNVDKVKIVSK